MGKTMKQLPREIQPRERAMRDGIQSLSNMELLAVVLRTGNSSMNSLELASRILAETGGLNRLREQGVRELCRYPGMGQVKALTLLCALELGSRLNREKIPDYTMIRSPQDAAQVVMEDMRHLKKENFRIIILDTKNHVLAVETISVGSLNSSIVHPRELFREAIRHCAAGVILVHNHPSGEVTPSPEDLQVTTRLVEAGRIMGIEVMDHLIIGRDSYLSFREEDLI